jgi:hypothetical protein
LLQHREQQADITGKRAVLVIRITPPPVGWLLHFIPSWLGIALESLAFF